MKPEENPLRSVATVIATSSKDWSLHPGDAWIWGIVNGWNREALAEVSARHRWTAEDLDRLERLRAKWIELESVE